MESPLYEYIEESIKSTLISYLKSRKRFLEEIKIKPWQVGDKMFCILIYPKRAYTGFITNTDGLAKHFGQYLTFILCFDLWHCRLEIASFLSNGFFSRKIRSVMNQETKLISSYDLWLFRQQFPIVLIIRDNIAKTVAKAYTKIFTQLN